MNMKNNRKAMTWEEKKTRYRKIRNFKAAVIAVLLLAASITIMVVLHNFVVRAFNVFLWFFGSIGFVKFLWTLVVWISDLTVERVDEYGEI